jgi:hypothetical protein
VSFVAAGASVTTTSATGFAVGAIAAPQVGIVNNPTGGNEFSAGGNICPDGRMAAVSLISSSAGSHTPSWEVGSSVASYATLTVAFKAAGGGDLSVGSIGDGMEPAAEIDSFIARFVDGQPFWEFWKAFMDFYRDFDDSVLSAEQRMRYEQLYEWVYIGQPDPAPEDDRAVGLVGEAELRARPKDFRVGGE